MFQVVLRTERKLCGAEFSGSLSKRPKAVGQGVANKAWHLEIGSRLTGLVRDCAPARGRQARPDLTRVKSGKMPGRGGL